MRFWGAEDYLGGGGFAAPVGVDSAWCRLRSSTDGGDGVPLHRSGWGAGRFGIGRVFQARSSPVQSVSRREGSQGMFSHQGADASAG